jgi:hypothetical protein
MVTFKPGRVEYMKMLEMKQITLKYEDVRDEADYTKISNKSFV